MTTAADELRTAAARLRELATRTATTLERHEVDWTDLTVSDTAAQAKARPMVWSQYAAAMGPAVGIALADWLDRMADANEAVNDWTLGVVTTLNLEAIAVARAINGGEQR